MSPRKPRPRTRLAARGKRRVPVAAMLQDNGAKRARIPARARAVPVDAKRWTDLVARMAGKRILVHADLVADEFVRTGAARISREAPVLILQYRGSRIVPGGGANAAANIAALGGMAVVVGEVGDDSVGQELMTQLGAAGADLSGIIVRSRRSTPRKTRVLAGDRHVAQQQVVRIDRIDPPQHDEAFLREVKARLVKLLPTADGVLVSDYGLGFVDPESVQALILEAPARSQLKVALDSRHRLFEYAGVDVATPSEPELEAALGRPLPASGRLLAQVAQDARSRLRAEALVLTRGSLGMVVFDEGEEPLEIPPFGSGGVADVTGAGDTVIATLSLALAAGADHGTAARMANTAAGIAVTKMGTATVSAEELEQALTRVE